MVPAWEIRQEYEGILTSLRNAILLACGIFAGVHRFQHSDYYRRARRGSLRVHWGREGSRGHEED